MNIFYSERYSRQCPLLTADNVLRARQTLARWPQIFYIVSAKWLQTTAWAFGTTCPVVQGFLEGIQQILPRAVSVVYSAIRVHTLYFLRKAQICLCSWWDHLRHVLDKGYHVGSLAFHYNMQRFRGTLDSFHSCSVTHVWEVCSVDLQRENIEQNKNKWFTIFKDFNVLCCRSWKDCNQ